MKTMWYVSIVSMSATRSASVPRDDPIGASPRLSQTSMTPFAEPGSNAPHGSTRPMPIFPNTSSSASYEPRASAMRGVQSPRSGSCTLGSVVWVHDSRMSSPADSVVFVTRRNCPFWTVRYQVPGWMSGIVNRPRSSLTAPLAAGHTQSAQWAPCGMSSGGSLVRDTSAP